MRQQVLHGYVLHQRPYRENSRLVHLLTLEYGRVDGVLRQSPPPLYQPILLYASGKSALKSLSKLEWVGAPRHLQGTALFAGFYVNELLVRLAPLEEASPELFAAYVSVLEDLQGLPPSDPQRFYLMSALRRFERVLLAELGYAIRFDVDALGVAVQPAQLYRYDLGEGFNVATNGESGSLLLKISQSPEKMLPETVAVLTRVYRRVISALLGERPLKSRELWVASQNSNPVQAGLSRKL